MFSKRSINFTTHNISVTKEENKSRDYLVIFMKYTARHVRKFIEQGKIDSQLWKMHFPSLLESRVPTCDECDDFKSNLCTGGKDPVECFLAIEPCTDQQPDDEKIILFLLVQIRRMTSQNYKTFFSN